jgi:hypothetical protein
MSRGIGTVCVAVVAGSALLASGAALAELKTFPGLNLSPDSKPSGEPLTVRNSFIEALASFSSDGLTNAFSGTPKETTFSLLGGAATLKGADSTLNGLTNVGCTEGDNAVCSGRFDTTGDFDPVGQKGGAWWDTAVGFTIGFTQAVSAFGFYASDVGDWDGELSLTLMDTTGKTVDIPIRATQAATGNPTSFGRVGTSDPVPNGTLLFFGFTDTERQYTSIQFNLKQKDGATTLDYLGFDDFITGPLKTVGPPTGVPEPATLALVAASLGALAATRRRRPR